MLKISYKTTSSGLLAAEILSARLKQKNALVLALSGDLGAGKTTFVQGFLRGLGIKKKITSPTFIIMKKFQVPKSKIQTNFKIKILKEIYHIDCYRIKNLKEFLLLDLKNIFNNPQNIVLIEWAEKIRRILPKNAIWLKFKHGEKENIRKIIIR
jgi:tRNA threonylcarbamoyladenosine biosynthesis protein TsaE